MVIAATNSSVDVIAGKLTPGFKFIENYQNLLANQDIYRGLFNSFKYSIVQTVVSIVICSLAGYGFEVYHDKYKDALMGVILMSMMIPFVSMMVPLFRMFSAVNLLNTTIGFILPSLSTPFLIMLFRSSARSFPMEMIEAARIDGLGEFQIFVKMFVPTMKSTYAAAITVTFMNAWNNYIWPKVIMQDSSSQTMPMMISNLTSGYFTDYGMLMLAVFITTLPTAVLFLFMQKNFREGLTGSVKG
ncbi:MAG: carbohydrate ABC transporter permease [Lachnospiraceae bacterium]|nr:carbohydrate ABC transporter permease [Lachnospiraceae bacterium]